MPRKHKLYKNKRSHSKAHSKHYTKINIAQRLFVPAAFVIQWVLYKMYEQYKIYNNNVKIDETYQFIISIINDDYRKAKKMIDQGIDVNSWYNFDPKNAKRDLPLLEHISEDHYKSSLQNAALSIESGATVDFSPNGPVFPLFFACHKDKGINYDITGLLVTNNADILMTTHEKSFLFCASSHIHSYDSATDLMRILEVTKHNININAFAIETSTVCNHHFTQYALENQFFSPNHVADVDNNTVLHRAVFAKCYDTVKLLLDFGANAEQQNIYGITPLRCTLISNKDYKNDYSSYNPHYQQYQTKHVTLREASHKIGALLIEYGAKIYTQSNNKIIPFKGISIYFIKELREELLNRYSTAPNKNLDNIISGLSVINSMINKIENPNSCIDYTINNEGNVVCSGTSDEIAHGFKGEIQ